MSAREICVGLASDVERQDLERERVRAEDDLITSMSELPKG